MVGAIAANGLNPPRHFHGRFTHPTYGRGVNEEGSHSMIRRTRLAVLATALLAIGAAVALSASASHAQTPRGWARTITNPYLPLIPGSVWVYQGMKDGVRQTDVVRATARTKTILGVATTVVSDVATGAGRTLEATRDYYAQDAAGNVWYFGEQTKAYGPNGQVDTSGSWQAGRAGARPGIFMTAHPAVGDAHRQEYARGTAEDQYWLVDIHDQVSVPFASSDRAALTLEWSRLEPGVIDEKAYVPGIGPVREIAVQGPPESARLVRYQRGS